MIKSVLWDIDGTILNFEKSESYAVKKCFEIYSLGECTDEMIKRYSAINQKYWRRLEIGELTKQQVLVMRFREFFDSEGIICSDVEGFNSEYQIRLGDTVFFNDDGYELISSLRGSVKQYAVTNGTAAAQDRKLKRSGLDKLFDGIFISDKLGAEKPSPEFFDKVFSSIDGIKKDETLIVGDSLTSDIRGGNNAGILSCWYNPSSAPLTGGLRADYIINDLRQVKKIIADS
ncbi:MAG: YjjG family noncanonical pyrimidine nucleotidase [Acutalibacteraceae bacterium]